MRLTSLIAATAISFCGVLLPNTGVNAGYLNEAGGNLYGDSDINPMADPDINPMADPDINPCADPDISPMGC